MTPAELRAAASTLGKAAKLKSGRAAKVLYRAVREMRAAAHELEAPPRPRPAPTPRSQSNCRHDAMEG